MSVDHPAVAFRRAFTGAEVTWAGPHPFTEGFCFGFEDGTLLFTDDKAGSNKSPQQAVPSGEAVNGVAAFGTGNLAISTRADVVFVDVAKGGVGTSASTFPAGVHGIAATRSGYFVGALGVNGLLIVKPEPGEVQQVRVTEGTRGELYFLKAAPLWEGGTEALVFALRKGGIGVSLFTGYQAERNVHTVTHQSLDVIDVCGARPGSLAALAISTNGVITFFRNVLEPRTSVTIGLGGMEGDVYRVLCSSGHLFVLTSKALYVWKELASDLEAGVQFERDRPYPTVVPMEAIDINSYRDDLLLVVMAANEIVALSIKALVESPNLVLAAERFTRTPLEPKWTERHVRQGLGRPAYA